MVCSGSTGDYTRALADFSKAIEINPKNVQALCHQALIWAACPDEKFRDESKAVESMARVGELTERKDDSVLTVLSVSYAAVDDFDAAIKWLTKARALNPAVDTKFRDQLLKLYGERERFRGFRKM
ncbi:MAG TPA: hypothetical protein VK137_16560 [Planctomycetaceae bacterium]|nr:hypothetical protein [Planctomycetaceae bacterium]